MGCTESKPEAAVVPAPAKSAPPQVPTASKPAVVAEAPKVIPTLKTEEQAPKSSQAWTLLLTTVFCTMDDLRQSSVSQAVHDITGN